MHWQQRLKSSHTTKILFIHEKQGKEENHMGTKPLLKNGHGAKNMKVNGIHDYVSLTPRRDLR